MFFAKRYIKKDKKFAGFKLTKEEKVVTLLTSDTYAFDTGYFKLPRILCTFTCSKTFKQEALPVRCC